MVSLLCLLLWTIGYYWMIGGTLRNRLGRRPSRRLPPSRGTCLKDHGSQLLLLHQAFGHLSISANAAEGHGCMERRVDGIHLDTPINKQVLDRNNRLLGFPSRTGEEQQSWTYTGYTNHYGVNVFAIRLLRRLILQLEVHYKDERNARILTNQEYWAMLLKSHEATTSIYYPAGFETSQYI